jgi:hypothetical protein
MKSIREALPSTSSLDKNVWSLAARSRNVVTLRSA